MCAALGSDEPLSGLLDQLEDIARAHDLKAAEKDEDHDPSPDESHAGGGVITVAAVEQPVGRIGIELSVRQASIEEISPTTNPPN